MNDIILMALPDEAPEWTTKHNLFFTGLGKINASRVTTEIILKYQPQRIINFGTAGGITVHQGLHRVTQFVQRDMRCDALGVPLGQTPFEDGSVVLSLDSHGLVCSTGDNFVSDPKLEIPSDLVDMESYAIAKVCKHYGVTFECYKFVSDSANEHAHKSWAEMCAQGQAAYKIKAAELGI